MAEEYVICYRRPDGYIEHETAKTLPSAFGKVAHLAHDYPQIWVRVNPGGAIVLVRDRIGYLQRPSRPSRSNPHG
jgi:hypothetical protein